MEVILTKTFVLNLLNPTGRKRSLIEQLFSKYKAALELVVSGKKFGDKISLQKSFYDMVRGLGIPSMMACYVFRDAGPILRNGGDVGSITLPYNIPRSGNLAETERGNPVLSFRAISERIAVPIEVDGAYRRFRQAVGDGWAAKAFRLGRGKVFVISRKASLSKGLRANMIQFWALMLASSALLPCR